MSETTTTKPSIGIPYARAIVDEKGYGVVCPICGEVFRSQNTKTASRKYGGHFDANHDE